MAFVLDYRLLFTASYLATTYLRLPVALFYNRHFPHLENLKLIPFYEEIL
jgi:trehalose 6-phosphate synthase/phosphatase